MKLSDIDWDTWGPNMRANLVFIHQADRVLLIRKKTGLGQGKINGPGGKLEAGETPLQAAIREVQEELSITVLDPVERGELYFHFLDGLQMYVTVFSATQFEGTPTESIEAKPHWFDIDKIPFNEMWQDDQYWLPHMLKGSNFSARFVFDEEEMLDRDVTLQAATLP